MPFEGVIHIAYLPDGQVVGISKLARVVDIFAKLGVTVIDIYGATEASGIIARNKLNDSRRGSCGRLLSAVLHHKAGGPRGPRGPAPATSEPKVTCLPSGVQIGDMSSPGLEVSRVKVPRATSEIQTS